MGDLCICKEHGTGAVAEASLVRATSRALELDQPALKEPPPEPYQYAEWRARRVGLDYHVDIDGHYYSVPHRLIGEQLDARVTERTIELFCKGERVAVHMRGGGRGRHTTIPQHMPSAHP